MKRSLIAAIGAVAAAATLAYAAVNFTPEAGGFAGKGDVQTALGFNNARFQTAVNNNQIRFRYSDDIVVEGGACLNPNNQNPHPNDVWRRTSGLSSSVQFDPRNRRQVTGFFLGAVGSGGAPEYTDSCGGNRVEGPGTILDTQPGAGLEVSGDGGATWVSLPITP